MAEEKKAKKPRAPKKAGAGTDLPAEVKEEKAATPEQAPAPATQETAQKTAKKKTKQPAQDQAAVAPKKAKKAPAKAEEQAEKPAETVAETPAKTAEKKQKKSKKKAVETAVSEEKPQEKAVEIAEEKQEEKAVLPVETQEKEQKNDEKTAKKPAKKAQKTAKNTQKTDKKAVKNAPETHSDEKKADAAEEKKEEPAKVETKQEKAENKPAKTESKPALSKAEKQKLVKQLARECLSVERKWSELVDMVSQAYQDAYPTPENANLNDVKGRVGSLLYTMQADGEIVVDGKTVSLAKKEEKTEKEPTVSVLKEEKADEKPVIETVKAAEKTAGKVVEKPAETPEKAETTAVQKVEVQSPAPVYDLSALFDKKKPAKKAEEKPTEKAVADVAKEKAEEIKNTKAPAKAETLPAKAETAPAKTESKPAPVKKTEEKPQEKAAEKQAKKDVPTRRPMRTAKVDPVKDAFLKKLRSLGGNYFEYYSIYLLERYSRMNGRRLEGLRISGGEYDGGIDGELELTDRLGFRETIYVQAKNWEPTDERWWIGETILQQFIGAVAYRQAKEGKQHCRGMFITTSAFTTGAKEMLNAMSDKFVGYDGDDLYETAKECQFGVIQDEKGNWKVDEELLSGKKSFFFML